MHEGLGLAKRGIEAGKPQPDAALERGERDRALNGGELEGERRDGLRQSRESLRLEALDVELEEGGLAVSGDQRIERRHRHADPAGPGLLTPSRRIARGG